MRHRWKFNRVGGVDQVELRGAEDLARLDTLDQKLWVALAMPTRGIAVDARTLDLIDTDHDGRIRAPEIIAAARWVGEVLRDANDIFSGGDGVKLSALADGPVLAGARRILQNLGRAGAESITLADVTDTAKIFAETRFNGDGVVPADAAGDPWLSAAIDDVRATHGELADRSGKPGINQEKVDAFFTDAEALLAWRNKADVAVLPLGDATAVAADAVRAVRAKVNDWFTRAQLAAVDGKAQAQLAVGDGTWAELSAMELSAESAALAKLPLAPVGRALSLTAVNPAWSQPMATLSEVAVKPLVGARSELTHAEWQTMLGKLTAYETWLAEKPVTQLDKLPLARVVELVSQDARARLSKLIAEDAALADENAQIESVERIVRYQRDLARVLRNFVNFADFYSGKGAVFQAGTLYLDGRSCRMCVEIVDPGKHAVLAAPSASFLAYCECSRADGKKMLIVAAFTDGDSDQLTVGRNGVFYDSSGLDWDATIAKVVANPISLREAFWAPYKKLVRMIEDQVNKRAAAADEASTKEMQGTAVQVAAAGAAKPPEPKKIDVGTVAAIGVAIGGIGAMLTGLLAAFFGLGFWMPLGLFAVVLLISGPSLVLAWLKLRQRSVGPILDANGWAINARARINVPFGAALTDVGVLPDGSIRSLKDPFAEKRPPWKSYLAALVLATACTLWYLGKLDRYLPESLKASAVLSHAPAK
jgi:hypothetical protein